MISESSSNYEGSGLPEGFQVRPRMTRLAHPPVALADALDYHDLLVERDLSVYPTNRPNIKSATGI